MSLRKGISTMIEYMRVQYHGQTRYGIAEGNLLKLLEGSYMEGAIETGEIISMDLIDKVMSPFEKGKILGIGRNYHRPEFTSDDLPKVPKVFQKSATSIIQDGENIILSPMNGDVICEPELAVMISKNGSHIPKEDAMDYVLGYLVINDVTDRTLLKEDGGEWTRGKSTDTFLPMGRGIVTGIDPFNLKISCEINGIERAAGNTEDMIFDIPFLIRFISHFMTLCAGDIILTGTPKGIEIHDQDQVRIIVENVGEICNGVRFDHRNWNL